jgi:Domain of unknown function (DUF6916)
MLETYTVSTFAPHLGETFRLHPDAAPPFGVDLIEARALGEPASDEAVDGGPRAPFSIVFRGPTDRLLPQRIYRLEHDELGAFELFLVPIGPDRDGMRYEAVFG